MDTKPLERFATWARRELLSLVDAQASAVLKSSSVARTEQPETVRRLESEIERYGRQHVIDKVAYIWFNRIIALRFMDACGYTDAGIVSPAQGQEYGQPEILADAKRGNLDPEIIISKPAADAILGLLDGSRHSTDAEGEAYALLLTEYCRYWHNSMPFMFEREGDYTELLVPANLLADGAILSRARETLTEEVCDDVEVIGWLYQFYIAERKNEVFEGFKNKQKAGAEEIPAATQLFTPHWIVRYLLENSLGRLWMLNRPSSRLTDQMDYYIAPVDDETDFLKLSGPEELTVIDPACGSGHMLTYAFDLLYAIYEEEGYAPSDIPGLILTNNLHGTEIDPRAGALAAFALAMKARAKDRRFLSRKSEPKICVIEPISFLPDELDMLLTKSGDHEVEEAFWNQFREADTLGSLIQPNIDDVKNAAAVLETLQEQEETLYADTLSRARKVVEQAEVLSDKYAVVTANPPYMGSKNMDSQLSVFAKANFPRTKSDLFAMFIERALAMIAPLGYMAQVTMQSWMFLSSYERLRKLLGRKASIESLLHMDNMVMRIAFGTSATVWQIGGSPQKRGSFTYVQMSDLGDGGTPVTFPANNSRNRAAGVSRFYRLSVNELESVPGAPIAYWLPSQLLDAFVDSKRIGDLVSFPTSPHKTGDNSAFVRRWWEVSSGEIDAEARWVPYAKGGGARRWYGLIYDVVDWSSNALQFYAENSSSSLMKRRENSPAGITYSMLTSGTNTFRVLPKGAAFDMGGPAFFPEKLSDQQALAVANSGMTRMFLEALNPTLNLQVREVKQIPVPELNEIEASQLHQFGDEAIGIAKQDWNAHECALGFVGHPLANSRSSLLQDSVKIAVDANLETSQRLAEVERAIDRLLWGAVGLGVAQRGEEDRRALLFANPESEYGFGKSESEYFALSRAAMVEELVSYAVGCMFGRYSLDEPGLILADQGSTLQDYFARVSTPAFSPDPNNVIPFVDDGWFEDDIVQYFRDFLRTVFGEERFEENLRFVEESLGVKSIRDYFIARNGRSKFYDDHVRRYKNRPIYWMFSSPRGSFNALIYMHRYTPSTVSTVLNEYLREYRAKLEIALANADQAAAGGSAKDQREADRLRKVLVELEEYEHDVLYPLATRQLSIDLDDGVLVNYLRFGRALKNIGFEKQRKKVEGWTWPKNPLEPSK